MNSQLEAGVAFCVISKQLPQNGLARAPCCRQHYKGQKHDTNRDSRRDPETNHYSLASPPLEDSAIACSGAPPPRQSSGVVAEHVMRRHGLIPERCAAPRHPHRPSQAKRSHRVHDAIMNCHSCSCTIATTVTCSPGLLAYERRSRLSRRQCDWQLATTRFAHRPMPSRLLSCEF